MAASVLVGILILSLIAYLYTVFGDYSSLIQARLEEKNITEFNTKFTQYESYKDENGNWQNTLQSKWDSELGKSCTTKQSKLWLWNG